MSIVAKTAQVTGRVQGVWFRKNTLQQAKKLGVLGWAMNMEDGSVLVHAQGDSEQVDSLMEWLWKGSPLSRVDAVVVDNAESISVDDFSVR
jgi:acylphosphatase